MVDIVRNWTTEWESSISDYSVLSQSSGFGDALLELNPSSVGRRAFSLNEITTAKDVEVLGLVEIDSFSSNGNGHARIYARGRGLAGAEEAYYLNIRNSTDGFSLQKYYNGGSVATLDSGGSPSTNQQYWLRLRVENDANDDNTVKGKYWERGSSEPSSWNFDVTDTSSGVPDEGWVGVGGFVETQQLWDYFAVATNGDSASLPSEPIYSTDQDAVASSNVSGFAAGGEGYGDSIYGRTAYGEGDFTEEISVSTTQSASATSSVTGAAGYQTGITTSQSATTPSSTSGSARTVAFLDSSGDTSVGLRLVTTHYIGDIEIASINSAEFGTSVEVDELDMVDEDENVVAFGSEGGQSIDLSVVLTKQAHSSKDDIDTQRTDLKSLIDKSPSENTFSWRSKKGTLVVSDVSVPEDGETKNLKEAEIQGIFLPWPKYNEKSY